MKWIKIEDQSPPLMETVIVYVSDVNDGSSIPVKKVTTAWRESDDNEEISFYSPEIRYCDLNVTHWQRLPKPPKD